MLGDFIYLPFFKPRSLLAFYFLHFGVLNLNSRLCLQTAFKIYGHIDLLGFRDRLGSMYIQVVSVRNSLKVFFPRIHVNFLHLWPAMSFHVNTFSLDTAQIFWVRLATRNVWGFLFGFVCILCVFCWWWWYWCFHNAYTCTLADLH